MSGIGAKALSKVRDMELIARNNFSVNKAKYRYGSIEIDNNIVTHTLDSLSIYNRVDSFKVIDKHIYYYKIKIKPIYNNVTYLKFGTKNTDFNEDLVLNEWNTLKGVSEAIIFGDNDIFRLYHLTDTGYAIGDKIKYSDFVVIDLTETFGKGNEPTAEQMDIILSQFPNSWFDGTQSITKEFMIMLLSELNDVKSSVKIALGGGK